MTEDQHSFFSNNGYLILGKILTDYEVGRLVSMFDTNRTEYQDRWRYLGHDTHQTANCDVLSRWIGLDKIIRHPAILPVAESLMNGPLSILEVSARHMDVHPGAVKIPQQWHRDTPHLDTHPLRVDYLQAMVYLTDVNKDTHCFTISPEAADKPVLKTDEQLAQGGMQYLYGPPGTAILFNASVLHTATLRSSQNERKTIQTYYCHRDRMLGKLELNIPVELWRDHPDAGARNLYGPQAQAMKAK